MSHPRYRINSFIIKVFIDEMGERDERLSWYGLITHVPSGEQKYLKSLEDIVAFIKPYFPASQHPEGGKEPSH